MSAFNAQNFSEALFNAELIGVGAARSLDLLRNIDGAITALTHHTDLMVSTERSFARVADAIAACEIPSEIAEDTLVPVLETLQGSLVEAYRIYNLKMQSAISDPRLTDEDGVVDAFRRFLEAMRTLSETTERLRWCVLENNADAEGPHEPVVMSDPAKINDFLDSL